MLRKKEVFTTITPIPGFIPRQLAIDILHSHSEVITLNPLVLDHKPIPAPRDAASDEFYSTWYSITERVQFVPGLGKMGSGKISFNGCFHDMPWGLQTHVYAPMNVDLRNKYRIAGNQPGVEPPEPPEIGLAELGIPKDGLYLREDIEIKCNVAVVSFVKAELKKASKEMVQRIIKKAELLDAGVLQGMIEDGKLKTINPADRSNTMRTNSYMAPSPQHSPTSSQFGAGGASPATPYQVPRPMSTTYGMQMQRPGSSSAQGGYQPPPGPQELPSQGAPPYGSGGGGGGGQAVIMELPGDFYHPQTSPRFAPPSGTSTPQPSNNSPRGSLASSSTPPPPGGGHNSFVSSSSSDPRVSGMSYTSNSSLSRPTSLASDASSAGGMRSPPLDHRGFASELHTHNETAEEHHRDDALKKLDGSNNLRPLPSQKGGTTTTYAYNPADYAKMSPHMQQQAQMQQHYPPQQQQQMMQMQQPGGKYAYAAGGYGGFGQQGQLQQQPRYGNNQNYTFYTQ